MQNTDNPMQETTQPMEEWEKAFNKELVEMSPLMGRDMHNRPPLYELEFEKIDEIKSFIDSLLTQEKSISYAQGRADMAGEVKVTEDTSDGYHTFKELYEYRLLYNACLFNEWAKQGMYNVHKSQRHFDGELCFGRDDYFVVVATLPTGQISNHYPMSDWDLFKCEEVPKALAQWDGHDAKDVATRLRTLATAKTIIGINK